MEHIFEMSKSNALRYIIFMFPFHMNRKFKSLITHNFLMNLFIKRISKLRYQWKVRIRRMTLVENKMRVYFLKMIYTYIIDVLLKKGIGKRMKNKGCQKVLNQCYLQCYEYPVTFLCTHSTNYFGFHIFEKIMIYHNITIHCIIVVKITSVTILLIWNKYNSIKRFFFP